MAGLIDMASAPGALDDAELELCIDQLEIARDARRWLERMGAEDMTADEIRDLIRACEDEHGERAKRHKADEWWARENSIREGIGW